MIYDNKDILEEIECLKIMNCFNNGKFISIMSQSLAKIRAKEGHVLKSIFV
jgi:hypothetical protein